MSCFRVCKILRVLYDFVMMSRSSNSHSGQRDVFFSSALLERRVNVKTTNQAAAPVPAFSNSLQNVFFSLSLFLIVIPSTLISFGDILNYLESFFFILYRENTALSASEISFYLICCI